MRYTRCSRVNCTNSENDLVIELQSKIYFAVRRCGTSMVFTKDVSYGFKIFQNTTQTDAIHQSVYFNTPSRGQKGNFPRYFCPPDFRTTPNATYGIFTRRRHATSPRRRIRIHHRFGIEVPRGWLMARDSANAERVGHSGREHGTVTTPRTDDRETPCAPGTAVAYARTCRPTYTTTRGDRWPAVWADGVRCLCGRRRAARASAVSVGRSVGRLVRRSGLRHAQPGTLFSGGG